MSKKEENLPEVISTVYALPRSFVETTENLKVDYDYLKKLIADTGATLSECAAVLGCNINALKNKVKLDLGVDWHVFYGRIYPIFLVNLKAATLARASKGSDKALTIVWERIAKDLGLDDKSTETDITASYNHMKQAYEKQNNSRPYHQGPIPKADKNATRLSGSHRFTAMSPQNT